MEHFRDDEASIEEADLFMRLLGFEYNFDKDKTKFALKAIPTYFENNPGRLDKTE